MKPAPRVFIPQMLEKWDFATERLVPAFDFTTAEKFGELVPILMQEDNTLFRESHVIAKAKADLADFTEDDYFVAVGDPSIIAICAALIFRNTDHVKMLKWDRRGNTYIQLDINL